MSRRQKIGVAGALVVLIGLVVWAAPRRVNKIALVDQSVGWETSQAPPRRQIVWRPPESINDLLPPHLQGADIATPRLTDNGSILYFTVRGKKGQADIFRSSFRGNRWQTAQPVEELNTASDDIGAMVSHDGESIFFYSNRPGGLGGFDLYVSKRQANRWGPPANLGPQVNTPAHEYDPAISSDGGRLYFASNRSEEMANQPAPDQWQGTLRGRLGLRQFDLYVAQRGSGDLWSEVQPIRSLNRPDSDEGSPFISPRGAYLYFSSNRPHRPGEPANFDLYRARWTEEGFLEPENLGDVINTPADETEGALSREGFMLVFSSNRDEQDRLYLSAAGEVLHSTKWSTTHLSVVKRVWLPALLITLVVAGVLGVLFYYRGWLAEKAASARFFAASVVFHVLVVFVLAFYSLPTVVEAIVTKLHQTDAAEQPFDDNQHQSHEDGQQAWEKLADIKAPQTTMEVARQQTQPLAIPDAARRIEPTISAQAARLLPPEKVLFVPPPEPAPQQEQNPAPRPMAEPTAVAQASDTTPAIRPKPPPTFQAARPPSMDPPTRFAPTTPAPKPLSAPPVQLTAAQREEPAPTLPSDAPQDASPTLKPTIEQVVELNDNTPAPMIPPAKRGASPRHLLTKDSARSLTLPRAAVSMSASHLTTAPRRAEIAALGALGNKTIDAPPALGPIVSTLNRPRAKAKKVVYAEDNVGLREMFTLRQGDIRKQHIELFGGTDESESAVERGLNWLVAHQNQDGGWSLNNFHANCKGKHPNCSGAGKVQSNTAAAGLALLPLLAAGNTHQKGPHQKSVQAGIQWLVGKQKPNGDLLAKGDTQHMYSHCIAAIALCEAYGMTSDAKLKPHVQKALEFITAAQHQGTGGWRYNPRQAADTSVVGWAMMALKSGEMAGITPPQKTIDNVAKWLRKVEGNKPVGGVFGYQNANPTPAMTAEGLLCLQFMDIGRNEPRMRAGADYLLKHLPQKNQKLTSYYWYYATQVMYHMQGRYWKEWNEKLRDHLVATQIKDGPLAGTWNPQDNWEQSGGRIYATSVKLLMLEVYYRHLPLFQQLDEDGL